MRTRIVAVTMVAVIAMSALVLVGWTNVTDAADAGKETIKIGYLGTLSGPFGVVEPYQTPGVQMVIDDVNAKGGLLGKKVELIIRDDQGDPSLVSQKLNELKAAGCIMILGAILDISCPPTSQWANDNKIPAILPGSAILKMRTTAFSKYAFNTVPVSYALANIFAKNFAQQNIKSIYFIGGDVGIAHDVYNLFWPAMKKIKPDTANLGSTWMAGNDMEFSEVISATLAKKPDLILMGIAGPPYSNFVQQARRFNLYKKTKTAGPYLLSSESIVHYGKTYPEGIMAVSWCPFSLSEKPMKDLTDAFLARTKLYPSEITMSWHISALAAIAAIRKANSIDADKLVNALETMSFDTPLGKVRYRDFDHQATLPVYFATSGYSKDFPLAIGVNPVKYGEEVYPTKAEIEALRAAK